MSKQATGSVDLTAVPPWPTHPVELITLATRGLPNEIRLEHHADHLAPYGFDIREMVDQYLRPKENPTNFFNGQYANVDEIHVSPERLTIVTGVAEMFPYLAAAWHYRNNTSDNAIHPLAVQTVILDKEERHTILVERRPMDIVDHPGKLSVLGGALQPGELPRVGACRCLGKWGIPMDPAQLMPLALTHEPADRIYCLVFVATLPGYKIAEAVRNLAGKREIWAEPLTGYPATRLSLLTKRNIHDWNPLGFLAFACAAFARWEQSEDKVRELLNAVHRQLLDRPYQYTFPMQAYLPTEQQEA